MAETAEVATGLIDGEKLYQKRARRALPILVRQAKAHQTMFYGELAAELGMSNPQNMNYPLGAVGNAMQNLADTRRRPVPPIQALVINQSTGLPGEGVAPFAPDAKAFKRGSQENRKLIVDRMLHDVFTYPDWDLVLEALGLEPVSGFPLPPVSDVVPQGGRGEGAEHRALKNAVARNPGWVGLPRGLSPGKTEARLYSGDSLDVLFRDSKRRTAVEVKGRSALPTDIVRGLFQCVKYEAVLNAQARARGLPLDCEAVLALGGGVPSDLVALRHTLGVKVFEDLGDRLQQHT